MYSEKFLEAANWTIDADEEVDSSIEICFFGLSVSRYKSSQEMIEFKFKQ